MIYLINVSMLREKNIKKQSFELTHNLYFQCSTCAVSLCVACYAGVSRLIAHSFDIFNDECAIREDLLLSVDRQDSGISFPDNALDRISSNRAGNAQSFSSNDGLLIHVTNERQTINVETGRMLSGSDLSHKITHCIFYFELRKKIDIKKINKINNLYIINMLLSLKFD